MLEATAVLVAVLFASLRTQRKQATTNQPRTNAKFLIIRAAQHHQLPLELKSPTRESGALRWVDIIKSVTHCCCRQSQRWASQLIALPLYRRRK